MDDEDGVQWWWAMKMKMAFNGGGSIQQQSWWGIPIGDEDRKTSMSLGFTESAISISAVCRMFFMTA